MSDTARRTVAAIAALVASLIVGVLFWKITFSAEPDSTAPTSTGVRAPAPAPPVSRPSSTPIQDLTDGVNDGDTSGDAVVRDTVNAAVDVLVAYRSVTTPKRADTVAGAIVGLVTDRFLTRAQDTWSTAPWARQPGGTTTKAHLITAQMAGDTVRAQIAVRTDLPDGTVMAGDETWDITVAEDGRVAAVTLV